MWMEDYLVDLERVFRWFQANKDPNGVKELCELRGYFNPCVAQFLEEYGVVKLRDDADVSKLRSIKSDLGLFSEKGSFLLEGRFIVPIKDLDGNVLTFVGWYPDERKYITLATKLFKRNYLLFGMEQLPYDELVVVEGIFDSLHLRANGIPSVAVMGAEMSIVQREWCRLAKRVWAIPDNDQVGRKVVKQDKWGIQQLGGRYLVWWGLRVEGHEDVSIKDIDSLCCFYEVYEILKDLSTDSLSLIININKEE